MHVVGQEKVQAEIKGGLGHTGRSISCTALVSPAASALVLLTPLCPVCLKWLGLLSALCCPGSLELYKYFWGNLVFSAFSQIHVSKGMAVFTRPCYSGKKIWRNCLSSRLLKQEKKTKAFFTQSEIQDAFSTFFLQLIKLLLTCEASKPWGWDVTCDMYCWFLGFLVFSRSADLLELWLSGWPLFSGKEF